MWSDDVLERTMAEFEPLTDPQRADAMAAYMKQPFFLGISAPKRRAAQRAAWRDVATPSSQELCLAAAQLRALPQREYHYAAAEILGRWVRQLEPWRLDADVRDALLHQPWWDTVDLLGSEVVTPLVRREPELVAVMWEWNATDDQWLIRASIQHQRGCKSDTDVPLLLALCEPHVSDRRFFVAKAIGWALRDTTRIDVVAVSDFVDEHPDLAPVAKREARRGIDRMH